MEKRIVVKIGDILDPEKIEFDEPEEKKDMFITPIKDLYLITPWSLSNRGIQKNNWNNRYAFQIILGDPEENKNAEIFIRNMKIIIHKCALYVYDNYNLTEHMTVEDIEKKLITNVFFDKNPQKIIIYPKIRTERNVCVTKFCDTNNKKIENPLKEYTDTMCHITGAIRVDSIIIGEHISLKLELESAKVEENSLLSYLN